METTAVTTVQTNFLWKASILQHLSKKKSGFFRAVERFVHRVFMSCFSYEKKQLAGDAALEAYPAFGGWYHCAGR
jgi:hypothetical protein